MKRKCMAPADIVSEAETRRSDANLQDQSLALISAKLAFQLDDGSSKVMDFLDDEAGVSGDESVLVPSSQAYAGRRRRKRRRISTDDEDSQYELPSPQDSQEEDVDVDSPQYKSKYEDVMHVVQHAETQKVVFVTQLTQPWSSPTRIRGPRWIKKTTPQTPISRPTSREDLKAAPPAVGRVVLPEQRPGVAPQPPAPPPADDEFDDDDPALLEALMSSPLESASTPVERPPENGPSSRNGPNSMRQTTLFGVKTTQRPVQSTQIGRSHNYPLASRNEPPTHHILNTEAMQTWTYPINLGRIRDYQYNIVHKSLFNNLLVALPTGLGKTFIAATVMLNWYRWTKDAQIVFVAPTRPLVTQQAEACYQIAGIPKHETIILTGEVNSAVRAEDWEEKRIFFMTPQTLMNDLDRGSADPKKIILLVVDEAHKATGNYAYVQVVKFLRKHNSSFRVLALTATPGGNLEAVQKVIDGLDIARVEIRTEESIDIREFVYTRDVQLEVFDNSDELNTCLELFAAAVQPVLSQLCGQNAFWGRDPLQMTLYGLRMAQQKWNQSEAGKSADYGKKNWIRIMFQPLMSLAHNLELLKFHGIGPFYHKMRQFEGESYGLGKYAKQIIEGQHYKKLMNYMRAWVNNPEFLGHPKLEYLKQVVLNHFLDADDSAVSTSGRAAADTRIMVFAHYRDSAEEIVRLLKRHGPMVKPHIFVGQSSTKGSEGMNQTSQNEILKQFKSGNYNTLVATSIGEEGLDIGEVDLIVCYDCSKSPIRMLQRMGRTGRKRAGKISVLLMRGKEENDYYKAKDSYQKMQEIIESGQEFTYHDDRSPRIVPKEIVPVVDKRIVDIPVENTQGPLPDHKHRKPKKPQKERTKKFHLPEGVETGFQYLGGGRKASKQKTSAWKALLDVHDATLLPPDQVLLTEEEQSQLEQNYQQIAGDKPQYIDGVQYAASPQSLRRLDKTSRVKHSTTTKALVSAFKAMRQPNQDWTRPPVDPMLDIASIPEASLATQDSLATPRRRSAGKGKARSAKTSIPLESSDTLTPGECDDADSFIDNASEDPESPGTSPDLTLLLGTSKAAQAKEQPFWVSQKSNIVDAGSDEEEFPELENLFGPRGDVDSDASKSVNIDRTASKRQARRRVLDSDDDE